MRLTFLSTLCLCGLMIAGSAWADGPKNAQETALVTQMKKAYEAKGLAFTPQAEEEMLQRYRQVQGRLIQSQVIAGTVDKSTPAGAMAALSAAMQGAASPPVAPSSTKPADTQIVATATPADRIEPPQGDKTGKADAKHTNTTLLTELPADLQSAKTVWVPVHVAEGSRNWSQRYQLYINGQRVRTPVGESVGGFIKATDGGYIALVHVEPGSPIYLQLQSGFFEGPILTPNMRLQPQSASILWAFHHIDASGGTPQLIGIAACELQARALGTVRTEATPDALYCHEAFRTNGEDALVGVAANGQPVRGPTGYAQLFAAKDYFVGAVSTIVNPAAICNDPRSRLDYYPVSYSDGRWTRGTQPLVGVNQSKTTPAVIGRVAASSVYVDMPSYSPTWLTNVVMYESLGRPCSSNFRMGAKTVRAQGLLPEIASWVATGAKTYKSSPRGIYAASEYSEHGDQSAPVTLGAGSIGAQPYGLYVARSTSGLNVLSAVFGGGNSIGLAVGLRSYPENENLPVFRPTGSLMLNYVSIQTPNNFYIVPLHSQTVSRGKPGAAGQAYSVAAEQWVASEPVQMWMAQYLIEQPRPVRR